MAYLVFRMLPILTEKVTNKFGKVNYFMYICKYE